MVEYETVNFGVAGSSPAGGVYRGSLGLVAQGGLSDPPFLLYNKTIRNKTMTETIDKGNDNWKVMNDLDDAFSQIGHLEFLIDELQRAVNKNDRASVIDLTAALTAFMPVYTAQYDRAQTIAWTQVVGQPEILN